MIVKSCADIPIERGLIGQLQRRSFAGIDESKRLGKLTALQVDRLVLGTVDVHHLARAQANSDTRSRVAGRITAVPHHDVDAAMTIARHVKGDDALAANRGEDGLVRPTGPRFWASSSECAGKLASERARAPAAANPMNRLRVSGYILDLLLGIDPRLS